MGVAIPQVITEDRAGGAQIIDGGLRFDKNKSQRLQFTPSNSGNRRTWTISYWYKNTNFANTGRQFQAGTSDPDFFLLGYHSLGYIQCTEWNTNWFRTGALLRDTGWYHIVLAWDTTQATNTERWKFYINGVRQNSWTDSGEHLNYPSQNSQQAVNKASVVHQLGSNTANSQYTDGHMAQVYFIDGQALDPSYFGFTDPLTNTWRPKKFKPQATPNDGTVWSSGAGSNFESGNPASNGFNGNPETFTRTDNATVTATVTFPTSIPFTTLQVRGARDSGNGTISINGVDVSSQFTSSSATLETITITGVTSPLTSISLGGISGAAQPRFSQIIVDGVTLIDGDTSNMGLNGFYLPFDGSAPIGQDQSGRGNNWTPVNFGGSNTLEKATGALPILNTDGGGKVARVGVRTDDLSSNLKLAVDHAGSAIDRTNAINGNTNLMTSFSANNSTYAYPTDASGSPYGKALYINGTSDYPRINFTAGDFNFMHNQDDSGTVEFWFYNGAYSTQGYIFANVGESSQVGLTLVMGSATTFNCYIQRGVVGGSQNAGTSTLPQNEWSHIAVTKQKVGSNVELKVYVNGVNTASNTSITATDLSNSNSAQTYWQTGSAIGHEGSRGFTNAYISDIRIYNTVKYTQNFIPASTDPDILPDTPSGVAYSSNVALVPSTDGAVAFDGTNDKLSLNVSNAISTTDFTVECFVYPTELASSSNQTFIEFQTGTRWIFGMKGSTNYMYFWRGSEYISSTPIVPGTWNHVAWVKSGTTVKQYLNGIEVQSQGSLVSSFTSDIISIGENNDGVEDFEGFISNVRVVESALYTSNFTPPTAPLTATENTKLLCCASQTLAGAATSSPNISGINNGTVWSNYLSNVRTDNDFAIYGFDGSLTTKASTPGTGDTLTFTPPTAIPYTTSVEVYTYWGVANNVSVSLNGGSAVTDPGNQWTTITTGSGSITSMTFTGTTNSGQFSAIRVDGVILKDPVTVNGNAAATNFNPFTANINAVRGQESGYCVMNVLDQRFTDNGSFSNGNLRYTQSSTGARMCRATIGVSSGKWYWEWVNGGGNNSHGISLANESLATYAGGTAGSYAYWVGGEKYNNNSPSSYGAAISVGDVVGTALDLDAGTLTFYKNGISQGVAFSGLSGTFFPAFGSSSVSVVTFDTNFGQKPFKFPPPAGFQPLALANTPRPSIVRPDQYVGIITYVGAGATKTFTGLNFGDVPDLVWMKNRDRTSYGDGTSAHHFLYDTVRGTGTGKMLTSSTNEAEGSKSTEADLDGFVKNGFRLDAASGTDCINNSGDNFVAWCWKAGGNKNTFNVDDVGYASASAAGLTAGTITPTGASVNTKSGFSIITYTGNETQGATVAHGLQKEPAFIIIKRRTGGTSNWLVGHKSLATNWGQVLYLNLTDGQFDQTAPFNDTAPTSSVWTMWDSSSNNASGSTYVAYLWSEIPGFSKFGSYTGNGSTDGTMVVTGFKPRWVLIKRTDATATNWMLRDSTRSTYNVINTTLAPNTNTSESGIGDIPIDFLSNGFKLRDASAVQNANGVTYIYAAFAEAPSFNLYGAQSNAR